MVLDTTFFLLFVNFIIVLVILKKFLFKPFLENYAKREGLTKGFLQKKEEYERLAENRLEEYRRRMHHAKIEIDEDLADMQKGATAKQKEIVDSAMAESRDIMEKTKAEIEEIEQRAKKELQEKTRSLSVEIAEKVLGRRP